MNVVQIRPFLTTCGTFNRFIFQKNEHFSSLFFDFVSHFFEKSDIFVNKKKHIKIINKYKVLCFFVYISNFPWISDIVLDEMLRKNMNFICFLNIIMFRACQSTHELRPNDSRMHSMYRFQHISRNLPLRCHFPAIFATILVCCRETIFWIQIFFSDQMMF